MTNVLLETKPEYTKTELKDVLDIVSEFYEGDDIEAFIYSTDVEDKENFIEDNGIESLRVCVTCGKFITKGYNYNDYETFCSKNCFIDIHGKSLFDNADDDELYWTDF